MVSPSSEFTDTITKLVEYFSVPSVQHYLIVSLEPRAVVHHARAADGTVVTRIAYTGRLRLDPPGLDLDVDAILAEA